MASNNQAIPHFADPHQLEQTQYRHDEAGLCNICLLKLAGLSSVTYGCYACNIHLHSACARDFKEVISFFAHPAHPLNLRRSPGRVCDICREDCPQESFVYSCIGCGFDVHPLCSMLPERVASPSDPSHLLCMFSSESPAGNCSACHGPLPRWHYIGSSLKLHVACAIDTPTGGAGQGSSGHAAVPVYGAAGTGSYGSAAVFRQGSRGADSQRSFGAPAGPVNGPAGYNPFIHGYGGHPHAGQAGSYYYAAPPAPIHSIYVYGPAIPSSGCIGYGASGSGHHQSIFQSPSSSSLMMSLIARFLFGTAISSAGDLLSDLVSASFN